MVFKVQSLTDSKLHTQWHTVAGPHYAHEVDAFLWCKDHSSAACFYFGMDFWYFECERDAMLFTLRWG